MTNVTVKVYEWEQYDGGEDPPEDFVEFVAWAQELLEEIPEEFRDSARIEFDSRTRYDSNYASVCISYKRPETPEEAIAREARARERAARDLESARQHYEAAQRRAAAAAIREGD